ncbi:Uncharacterised protein [Candidatus Venteria ishoeyi]|uniref:Uncharacterized protein n=2 Tax=Candidatus Venteria ishoeyi TaxID=1899563 RepID=A0A1H6F4G7_9GAMM|nr:Uncharacterised protein [Candidatus Venteria ishoeyi]
MLQTVEGIAEKNGAVHLLEPIHPDQPMRVLITLLEPVEKAADNSSKTLSEIQLEAVAGCLAYSGKAKTLEEMEAAIARGIQERAHDRD